MITDLLLNALKKDPFIKRNILKTITWRVVGSVDTVLLAWLITGTLTIGTTIGLLEFFTKMLFYYLHERAWQKSTLGLPSREQMAQNTKQQIKPNLFVQTGKVSRLEREKLNSNPSFTIWFTGLSGSGKSTMAAELEKWIFETGRNVYILDGDNTRLGINSDLSFTDEDRAENIRRVAEMCRLFNDAGIIVIASFISPFTADREKAKKIIGEDSFVEVFIDASLSICQQRDTKGLYKLAAEGRIKNFTGISSPYEAPVNPDIHLQTGRDTVQQCLENIKEHLIAERRITIEHPKPTQ